MSIGGYEVAYYDTFVLALKNGNLKEYLISDDNVPKLPENKDIFLKMKEDLGDLLKRRNQLTEIESNNVQILRDYVLFVENHYFEQFKKDLQSIDINDKNYHKNEKFKAFYDYRQKNKKAMFNDYWDKYNRLYNDFFTYFVNIHDSKKLNGIILF